MRSPSLLSLASVYVGSMWGFHFDIFFACWPICPVWLACAFVQLWMWIEVLLTAKVTCLLLLLHNCLVAWHGWKPTCMPMASCCCYWYAVETDLNTASAGLRWCVGNVLLCRFVLRGWYVGRLFICCYCYWLDLICDSVWKLWKKGMTFLFVSVLVPQ